MNKEGETTSSGLSHTPYCRSPKMHRYFIEVLSLILVALKDRLRAPIMLMSSAFRKSRILSRQVKQAKHRLRLLEEQEESQISRESEQHIRFRTGQEWPLQDTTLRLEPIPHLKLSINNRTLTTEQPTIEILYPFNH